MKKCALLFVLISLQTFAITKDFRYLKVRDTHLIFDDKLNAREVAITFSGKISPDILVKILDKLKSENLIAHFFLNGDSAIEHQELLYKIGRAGHVIGSQGLSISKNRRQNSSEQEMLSEIQTGHEAVYMALGYVYPFIRLAPRQGSIAVREMIKESGAFAFYWNIDFFAENPAQSIRDNLKREEYRGIVAFPLFRESTLVALDALIDEIKKEDLTVITILPSPEGYWLEYPPLIRKNVQEEILKKGPLYYRKIQTERGGYEI